MQAVNTEHSAGCMQLQLLMSAVHVVSLALSLSGFPVRVRPSRDTYTVCRYSIGLFVACDLQLQVLLYDTGHIMSPALSLSACPN